MPRYESDSLTLRPVRGEELSSTATTTTHAPGGPLHRTSVVNSTMVSQLTTSLPDMPLVPRLPPELLDEALDHLWDDPKSLKACALTSRAWVPTTRLHLFRTVLLSSLSSTTRFFTLLQSTPVIAHCVRKLSITAQYTHREGQGEERRASEDDGWVNACADIVRTLGDPGTGGRVHTLALSRMRWGALEPTTRAAFKGLFHTVRTLFLFEVRFDASGDVLEFLNAFPNLEELYFHAVSWERESAAPVSDAQTDWLSTGQKDKMHLTYLFLDSRSSPTLVTEWILSHPSEEKLRTIQLCWRELDSTKALGDLLQASGSSLERLQIEFPAGVSEEAVLHNHLSLVHNTSLRSLSFGGLDISADTSRTFVSTHLFPWVTRMLEDVHSHLLHEITFQLETPDVHGLDKLDWARIDQELSRRAFIGLTVRFYVSCAEGDAVEDKIQQTIEGHLPGFARRGVLRVKCL